MPDTGEYFPDPERSKKLRIIEDYNRKAWENEQKGMPRDHENLSFLEKLRPWTVILGVEVL